MDIRELLVKKGLCVACFEKAMANDYRCEEHRFYPELLEAILSFEINTASDRATQVSAQRWCSLCHSYHCSNEKHGY